MASVPKMIFQTQRRGFAENRPSDTMWSHLTANRFLLKLRGYYLIPHELLHVLAYRLLGKRCRYRWGDDRVHPLVSLTRPERLFILLLPLVACWILGLAFHILWIFLAISARMPLEFYFFAGPRWHFLAPALATLCILYSGTAYRDIRVALRLLFEAKQAKHKPEDNHK